MENTTPIKIQVENLDLHYGDKQALYGINLTIYKNKVLSLIGPSGCGKSSFLRCLNRMNDMIEGIRIQGKVLLDDENIYQRDVDVVDLRMRVGMVFQRPNPFPKSIYDNVAYGPRIHRLCSKKVELEYLVEKSLKRAGLWNEVKDRLNKPATRLSGGQQ